MSSQQGTLLDVLKKKMRQTKEEAEKYQEEAEEYRKKLQIEIRRREEVSFGFFKNYFQAFFPLNISNRQSNISSIFSVHKVAIVTELGGFSVCVLLRRGNEQDGCLPDSKSLLQKTLSGCHFSMPFPLYTRSTK